jgi:hypothetical protein
MQILGQDSAQINIQSSKPHLLTYVCSGLNKLVGLVAAFAFAVRLRTVVSIVNLTK